MRLDWDRSWGKQFDDVFDEHGNSVATYCCNVPMKFDGEGYICPDCKRRISRKEFFERYAEPYGVECRSCQTNFPRCGICHKDIYQDKCDEYRWKYD